MAFRWKANQIINVQHGEKEEVAPKTWGGRVGHELPLTGMEHSYRVPPEEVTWCTGNISGWDDNNKHDVNTKTIEIEI